MIEIESVGEVRVVRMVAGENRFNGPFVDALHDAFDSVAAEAKPMVLTGDGKFFTNGLDLDWMMGDGAEHAATLMARVYELLARLLTFPTATAAAINGHAFGGGMILAAAADHRVMRADRGFLCMPEVDLGMKMSPEFDAVLQAKFPRDALLHALTSGHRYGGDEAVARGFAPAAVPDAEVVPRAVAVVADLAGKAPDIVTGLKARLYAPTLAVLDPSRPDPADWGA